MGRACITNLVIIFSHGQTNSPFHAKRKNMHGINFARGNAPFPYISMGQWVKFRVHTASCLTGCPNTTNINRKYHLPHTSCKLLHLLKMIIRKAIVCQRHLYLTAKIVCSTTKQKK